MRDGVVGVVQVEGRSFEIVQSEEPGANQVDQTDGGPRGIHPHPVDADAVSHDPRVRQIQSGAPQHPDASHQRHAAIGPHRHGGGAHRCRAGRRWQDIQHAIDRARRGSPHPLRIVFLVAAQFYRPKPVTESTRQILEHALRLGIDGLVPATRGLISARELQKMKAGAILIQASRGGVVDEGALAQALSSGHLGGAAIDVYETEPPSADNVLLSLSGDAARRILFTPHIAGVTRQATEYLFRSAWRNVENFILKNKLPQNSVQ